MQKSLGREAEIATGEKRVAALQPLVQQLNRNDPWFHAYAELTALLPPGVRLDTLSLDAPKLIITGSAPSPDEVGLFLQALADSPRFGSPVLTESEAKKGPVAFGFYTELLPREVKGP